MTKKTNIILLLLVFLLAACSSGGNQTNNTNTNNDQNFSNDQTDLNTENELADDPVYSPAASAAVCTAVTQPSEIILEPNDHVKGAVEDYIITLIEYGDFQ